MLERGSYIPWASRFRRYLNRKREIRKWLNKAIDEGPYEFKVFTPSETEAPRMQKEEDLREDYLKHYEAEIEAMNLILTSNPNDIHNYVDACTNEKAMWQRVELRFAKRLTEDSYDDLFDYLQQFEKLVNASRAKKVREESHDPLHWYATHGFFLIENSSPYYVTHLSSVVDYDDDYQGNRVQNNSDDPLTSAMILLARSITRNFSNPTNNRRRTSSNTRNQAIVHGDRVNIQSKNSGKMAEIQDVHMFKRKSLRVTMFRMMLETFKELFELRLQELIKDSKYFMEQMLLAKQDEAGVLLTDEQNDFLFADALRMEEIKELSANICLMTIIQPANINGSSNDSAFLSEVQTPSNSYVNPLFAKDNQEQKYPTQPKTINKSIGADQIDSNIRFDEPNENVTSGTVENNNNVQESYALEQLARNAYKEAEKQQIIAKQVQQQNIMLTKQLELYKEKRMIFVRHGNKNELLKDQLLEARLKNYIECCVLLSHECVDNNMQDEIEKVQRDSIEIQEGMQKRINILENDVQRCQKQSLDFELQLQHEKEKRKCESSFKNICEISWVSKMEKLETKLKDVEKGKSVNTKFDKANVSKPLLCVTPLNKQVFQKKTVAPKIEEKHVVSKTVTLQTSPNKQQVVGTNKNVIAPGMYKVGKSQVTNTNKAKSVLSSTRLSATSSVRRPSNRNSSLKNSVISNTKNSSEKVEVSDRANKKSDVASKNVALNKIVTNDEIKNALIATNDTISSVLDNFCDGDLEVAFRSKTCYVRNLEGDDLLTGDRESNLYTISIPDMAASSLLSNVQSFFHKVQDMEYDVDISALTMEQYIALIPDDIKLGIVNPKIGDDVKFEINANFMRELRRKLFTGTDDEDAYEHVRMVLEIVDLLHLPKRFTLDQLCLGYFQLHSRDEP
ncbi:hypothetical protein Tco_0949974 [Tanacetum coccineum]